MEGNIHEHLTEGGICEKGGHSAIVLLISLTAALPFNNLYYLKKKNHNTKTSDNT